MQPPKPPKSGDPVRADQIAALIETAINRIVGVAPVQVRKAKNQITISFMDDRIIGGDGGTPVWVPYSGT